MPRLFLYGAGMFARALIRSFKPEDREDLQLLDKYCQQDDYIGVRVFSPFNAEALASKSVPVLNTTLGYSEVIQDLHKLGYNNVYDTDALFRLYPDALREFVNDKFMWRDSTRSYAIDNLLFQRIIELFSDKTSRDLFRRLISFRSSPTYINYPWPRDVSVSPMYFPNDIPGIYTYENPSIVDIGAFDGDTLQDFVNYYSSKRSSY